MSVVLFAQTPDECLPTLLFTYTQYFNEEPLHAVLKYVKKIIYIDISIWFFFGVLSVRDGLEISGVKIITISGNPPTIKLIKTTIASRFCHLFLATLIALIKRGLIEAYLFKFFVIFLD